MSQASGRRFVNPADAWDSTQCGFWQAVVAPPGAMIFVSGQVDWDRDQRIGNGRHPQRLTRGSATRTDDR